MKKAVLYARVSTDIQQKEGTIESQVVALKQQIVENGDVLVKEYVDAGHSGAKMDRPALDQLRKDIKTDSFDAIYFLNTDRIARDVAYQHIIVTEILRHKKQIIINGKDYVHNPENKFELTVLGAVAELERAKMLERSMRGKLHKLRSGFLLSYGYNIYGYNYIPRSNDSPARLEINEREAKAIRYIFETYAEGNTSWAGIIRGLEETEAVTKMGNKHWPQYQVRQILKNSTYSGVRYFNKCRHVKTESSPLRKIKYGKKVYRDKSEWIPIKVPAIVSQTLFDKAQGRLEVGHSQYKSPRQTQLLSNLVRCGECGRFCLAYRRYLRHYYKYKGVTKKVSGNVYYKAAYKCNRRWMDRVHLKTLDIKRCTNPEVSVRILDPFVWKMIEESMIKSKELKKYLVDWESNVKSAQIRMEKELQKLDQEERSLRSQREQTLNEYATGKLEQEAYLDRCLAHDIETNRLKLSRDEITKKIPIMYRKEVIDANIRFFCETAQVRFNKCTTLDNKRRFVLDFIEEILYSRGNVILKGSVPLQLKTQDSTNSEEQTKINFSIERNITEAERRLSKST